MITATGMAAITLVGYLIPARWPNRRSARLLWRDLPLFDAWHQRGERKVEFVNFGDEAAVDAALSKPGAPLDRNAKQSLLRITDIEAFAALGRASGALTVVDNTFLSPAWQQPLDTRGGLGPAFDDEVSQRSQRRRRRRGGRARESESRAAGVVG